MKQLLITIAALVLVGCSGKSIHQSSREGDTNRIEKLLKSGVNIDTPDESYYDKTPLHRALNHHTALFLIQKGANLNSKDRTGLSPLHDHAGFPDLSMIQILISNEADVNQKDDYNNTALHIASLHGYNKIIDYLISQGAEVNSKDDEGKTPLDWALNDMGVGTELVLEIIGDDAALDQAQSHNDIEKSVVDLLRKHGGKTGEELKAEGK